MWLALERSGAKVEACAACAVLKVQKATGTAEPGVAHRCAVGIKWVTGENEVGFLCGNAFDLSVPRHEGETMEISWHSPAAYASNRILMHSLAGAVVGLVMEAPKVVLSGEKNQHSLPLKLLKYAKITQALHRFFHAQEMFGV